jgi:hypothetical protein
MQLLIMESAMKLWSLGLVIAVVGAAAAALSQPLPYWQPQQPADSITLPRWVSYSRPGLPLAGYYPERAVRVRLGGETVIRCRVDGGGKLGGCQVRSETPGDMGFARATMAMTPWLTVDLAPAAGAPLANGEVDIPLTFGEPKLVQELEVTSPEWVERPTAAEVIGAYRAFVENQQGGDAAVRCMVSSQGLLAHCATIRQSDTSFGKAALSLTPNFRLRPLDANGAPVAGREIVVPFRFEPD